jgi:pimeloyl-ACP methyl ester carboxylesterase
MSKIVEVAGCNNPDRVGDIVFIHGLTGDPRSTWEFVEPSDGGYTFFWPEELGNDCPHFGVWSIGYESSPTKWLGHNMPMIDRATNILDLFDAYNLGHRPIFFVAHSLGGLLVKAILRHSSELPPEQSKSGVFRNTKGVAFFGTPHTGSGLANLGKAIPGFRPTEIIHELTRCDAYLRDLSNWFAEKAVANGFVCLAYSETRKTRGVIVVDAVSAAPGGVGMRPTPFDADHYSICKIPSQSDQRYKQIQKLLSSHSSSPVLPTFSTRVDGVDISLSVVPDPPKDGRCIEFIPPDRTLRYEAVENRDAVSIRPRMLYVEQQELGQLTDAVHFFWNPFKCQYPELDVKVVNNANKTLALNSVQFRVTRSEPDFSPVIVFKDNNFLMKLQIQNEGWGRIECPRIRCNIEPSLATQLQPDPPITHIIPKEPFQHTIELEDFAESIEVDLRSKFKDIGVDVETIEAAGYRSQQMYALHALQNGLDVKLAKHLGRFPKLETNEAWKSFPDGYAVVAGVLEFTGESEHGNPKSYCLPFRARVFLFNVRYDLPMPPSYQYNVELRSDGVNYVVDLPLSQSLRIGEADRFTIRVACDQSAKHEFQLVWKFVGGYELVGPTVSLNHFVPKTHAKQESELVAVGALDPQREQEQAVSEGTCIEDTFMNMFQMMAARDALFGGRDPNEENEGTAET